MLQNYLDYVRSLFQPGSKIAVAMSGGVDSSLTAALIRRAGFETVGITLKLHDYKTLECDVNRCIKGGIDDAKNIAKNENFLHYMLDFQDKFREKVIDNFVQSYGNGITPAPCSLCNKFIKFGEMLDFARNLGADFLVTGHYVQKSGQKILRAAERAKDQSYFLALVEAEKLKYVQFPLAKLHKSEVRNLAAQLGLCTANKPESQDICFIPDGNYREFLRSIRPEMFTPGQIFSVHGEVLGAHSGLANYTIGQRRGLGLGGGPWYVKSLNAAKNAVIVARVDELLQQEFFIKDTNLLVNSSYFSNREIEIQIRARNVPAPGFFDFENGKVKFLFPQNSVTTGQICAFYEGNELLGGGIIVGKKLENM